MKVEVLYVAECPSHPAAVELVKDVLAAEGITTEVHEVLISDEQMAGELKFLGSPTIRIDGRDVAGESSEPFGHIFWEFPFSSLLSGFTKVDAPANAIANRVFSAKWFCGCRP